MLYSWAKCLWVCVVGCYSCWRVLLCTGKKRFPSLFPPPSNSICIKISVKIKVCFCILQIVIQTVSRKELVIHFYIQHIYTHAWAPPKTIKLAGKKPLFPFSFQAQANLNSNFHKLIKNSPPFLQGVCRYESCSFPFQLCFFLLKLNLLSVQTRGWLSTMIYWGDGCPLPHSPQHLHPRFVFANFIFRRIYTQSSYINSSGDKSATHFHKQRLLLASCLPFFLKVKRKKP